MAESPKLDKEWMLAFYATLHSDMQWAKGQGWNAVQWTVLLQAALYAGYNEFTAISWAVWAVASVLLTALSCWWLGDLHRFAKATRDSCELLLEQNAKEERASLRPRRGDDPDHTGLFRAKVAVVVSAGVAVFLQIVM
jgi:hypothetical protein